MAISSLPMPVSTLHGNLAVVRTCTGWLHVVHLEQFVSWLSPVPYSTLPLTQHFALDLQDFLNGVCTHIIWLTKQKLTYYTGNYDTFCKTVKENEVIQQKKYEKEQDDIKHLKAFISSCGMHILPTHPMPVSLLLNCGTMPAPTASQTHISPHGVSFMATFNSYLDPALGQNVC